jgi:hypothetical protein
MAQRDVGRERPGVGGCDDPAEVEHHAPVRDRQRGPRVLLDQHDRDAVLPAEPHHHVHHLRHDLGREPERRLVEQQHPGPCDQGARDHQHLPLAARQGARQLAAAVGQRPEALVRLGQRGRPVGPPGGEAGPRHHADAQVLLHRELGDHALPLGHVRDPGPGHVLRAAPGPVGPVEQHPAGPRSDQAADRPQQGGLARPVGAEHGGDGARVGRDRDLVERHDLAVARHQVLDEERGGVAASARRRRRRFPGPGQATHPRPRSRPGKPPSPPGRPG